MKCKIIGINPNVDGDTPIDTTVSIEFENGQVHNLFVPHGSDDDTIRQAIIDYLKAIPQEAFPPPIVGEEFSI